MHANIDENSIWVEVSNKMADVKRIENEQNRLLEALSSEDKALMTAIKQGSLTDIKQAVAQGANPKVSIMGGNLLFWLGQNNSADVVESAAYLIDEVGLDVNQCSDTKASALNSCVMNFRLFAYYILRGANINYETIPGTSLFSQVVMLFTAEQIRYLLKNAKINLANEIATGTILNTITFMKKDVAVVLLEEIGYSTAILDNLLGLLVSMELDSTMSSLLSSLGGLATSIVKPMIAKQLDSDDKKSAAMQAIDKLFSALSTEEYISEFPVIAAILNKGANPNCHNMHGQPILCDLICGRFDLAEKKARANRLMQVLLGLGADPHLDFDYYGNASTPFKMLLDRNDNNIEQIKLMLLSKRGLAGITLENANTFIPANHPCHAFLLAGLRCQSAIEQISKRQAENATDDDAVIYDLLNDCLADGPEFLLKCLKEIHALPEEQHILSFEYLINYFIEQGLAAIPVEICEFVSSILNVSENPTLDDLLLAHLFAARTQQERLITSLYCRIMQLPDRIGVTLSRLAKDYPDQFARCEQLIREFQQKVATQEPEANMNTL